MKLRIILEEVNRHLGIDIMSPTRRRPYVYGRNLFMRLTKDFNPHMSLSSIGNFINKDHATILHGLKQFQAIKDFKQDKEYLESYETLLILLKNKKFISIGRMDNRTEIILKNMAPLRSYYGYI